MTNQFDPQPITLAGNLVTLCPLQMTHAEELFQAGNNETIWRYMPVPKQNSIEETKHWIKEVFDLQESGSQIAFAILSNTTGKAIGSTRYLDIQRDNRSLEVGWTWLSTEVQRSGINTECKFLLFQHAFETLGAVRVQLKTDARNLQSQTAIKRIGAKQEGILRKSRLVWDGVYRDTVYFSVLDTEWMEVKKHLTNLLNRKG